ncbi:hypothetical protein Trydic_g20465 [Trypoxylus dichotomus]
MNKHAAGNLFKCSHCEKSFAKKGYLTIHMKAHTNNKPLECHLCDKKFQRQYYLIEHLKRVKSFVDLPIFSCYLLLMRFAQIYSNKVCAFFSLVVHELLGRSLENCIHLRRCVLNDRQKNGDITREDHLSTDANL